MNEMLERLKQLYLPSIRESVDRAINGDGVLRERSVRVDVNALSDAEVIELWKEITDLWCW